MPLTLPTTPSPPASPDPHLLLLYGPNKVGKTGLLAATLPNALLLDCEPTHPGMTQITGLKQRIETADELLEVGPAILATPKPWPWQFIVADPIDGIEAMAVALAVKRHLASPIGKPLRDRKDDKGQPSPWGAADMFSLPQGLGYGLLRAAFFELIQSLCLPRLPLVFIGKQQPKYEGTDRAQQVAANDLDLTGRCRQMMSGLVDAMGLVARDGGGRLIVTFATRESVNCGSRCAHLSGQRLEWKGWHQIYTRLDTPATLSNANGTPLAPVTATTTQSKP